MRPYLERLPNQLHESFKAAVLKCVQRAYPAQSDGRVLFIFKRFFLIACKA
jgi:trans-aconitate 2-methyltransferase